MTDRKMSVIFPLAIALIGGIADPAQAYEHFDNPAYCFGFLRAAAQNRGEALVWQQKHAIELFGHFGPKDSTDERDFNDWATIGGSDYADLSEGEQMKTLVECGKWPKAAG